MKRNARSKKKQVKEIMGIRQQANKVSRKEEELIRSDEQKGNKMKWHYLKKKRNTT